MKLDMKMKLMCFAGIAVFCTVITGIVGLWEHTLEQGILNDIQNNTLAIRRHLEGNLMREGLLGDVILALRVGENAVQADREEIIGDVKKRSTAFREQIRQLRQLTVSKTVSDQINHVEPVVDEYITSANTISAQAFVDPVAAGQKFPDFKETFNQLETELGKLGNSLEAENVQAQAEAGAIGSRARNIITSMILGSALLVLLISSLIIRTLLRQLGADPDDIVKVSETIAKGDLTKSLDKGNRQLVGAYASMHSMQEKLKDVIGAVIMGTEDVAAATAQLATGNANLSQRTQEEASNLEEIASSMEEMTGTVKQNADNAQQANQVALAARDQASKGGAVVNNAINAMKEINTASKKIADIIGVIDEIAFQTNLLALNAAVEAARAGEEGRGFAVVATEVRNLAGRSAMAAKEIKRLIHDSVEKVEEGARLVNDTGKTLEEIVTSVKKTTDIVGEIAAASHEQSAGIEQVNKAMMRMDEVTQQNGALVEETASTSESISLQTRELQDLMWFFQMDTEAWKRKHGKVDKSATATSSAKAMVQPVQTAGKKPKKLAQEPASVSKALKQDDSDWQEF